MVSPASIQVDPRLVWWRAQEHDDAGARLVREGLMNAMQIVGIALVAFSVGPFIILIGACRNVRRELSVAGIREPALTVRTLSDLGGVTGFLVVSSLALIAGVMLAVFA
jgi:hypothetical protein